jgi:hypothetical protein
LFFLLLELTFILLQIKHSKTNRMKTKIYSLFISLLIVTAAFSQTNPLTILSPNGGETWLQGSTVTISWQHDGDPADLYLEYTEDGNYWYYLDYVYASDSLNSYSFQNYLWATDLAKIRISYYSDPDVFDESDGFFSVVEPPVYIYSPYYGDKYYRTAPVYISWYSQTITSFSLEYSLDNGANWTSIVTGIEAYDYTWSAADQMSDEVLIRISDAADPTAYGLSPLFSIVDIPTLSLTAPNGGETWTYGAMAEVSWTGTNLPYYLYIEFSEDGGSNWTYLGYGYGEADGGTAQVSVPYIASENAIVRVSDPNYDQVMDVSDAPFTVFVPPVIVYQPYEGAQIYNKSQAYVSWQAYDMDSVDIELSTDNGQSWQVVDQGLEANYGYYSWTLNAPASETSQLKISDASDPSRFGLSNVFIILEAPVITLTSPAGGEIWNTNTAYALSWSYDNPAAYYVYLEYSTDNGATWISIGYATHTGLEGSYEWTTPDVNADECLVRIRDYSLYFVSDTSAQFSILTYPQTPICMVTVDSVTNHNMIVWEKPASTIIDKFVVYKEGNQANTYEVLGMLNYADDAVMIDSNSNPNVKSYRYKLGFTDDQGNMFPAGDLHQTIHLTINQGVGNSWNLIWTDYIGFDVSSYNLYRKSGAGSYEQIASISASFNSYTDLAAPQGDVFYIVEVVNQNGCNPASRSGDYSVSRSNVATNAVLGVNDLAGEIQLTIYPNPVKDKLYIQSGESLKGNVSVMLSDLLGSPVYSAEMENLDRNSTFTLNTSELKDGIYMLRISSESGSATRKIVVKR